MKRLLLLIVILFPSLCRAQEILYYLPDSVEIGLYNQIRQLGKESDIGSLFLMIEKRGDEKNVSLGVLNEENSAQLLNIVRTTNRKAVVNQYRLPVLFDTDLIFSSLESSKEETEAFPELKNLFSPFY